MANSSFLCDSLEHTDKELFDIITDEHNRQKNGIELIASENFASIAVLECLGSCLTNKYSEGLPGKRYYGGNKFIDQLETLCQKRALKAFGLDEKVWGVNVQPYSGSSANMAVYTALLKPHDRLMGLDLPDGGHLTHGFAAKRKKISASSIFWESTPYHIDPNTGLINYKELEDNAITFSPQLIIAGFSSYPRGLDFKRFREISNMVGAILMADIAHVSGLVATGLSPNPFEYADVVTTTTHKILRGPRSGIIFFRKNSDLETKINSAVFPGLQGGPHNNVIAALATALKQMCTPEYKKYTSCVIQNCKEMQKHFLKLGYELATGGSDNHLILINLKNKAVSGLIAERALEFANISVNRNACPGDTNMFQPSGIRVGTPAITTRGFKPSHMKQVVQLIHECLTLTVEVISNDPGISLSGFCQLCKNPDIQNKYDQIKSSVEEFSKQFLFPGNF
ncbi:hypothetical protein MXB_925 [Myxobolus squamalis]|nr:hypothetical protein MXB_925 [Myxobolus squamalis]